MSAFLSLLICPLLIVTATVVLRRVEILTRLTAVLMWVQLATTVFVCGPLLRGTVVARVENGFRLDDIAALFVLLTTLVAAASLTHAVGFFAAEAEGEHAPTATAVRQFYFFTALFLIAMYGVVSADNLGFLWISIEATTLVSAPLVYYHRSRTALEATWKYLIICSVGIGFAFLGTAVFYGASQQVSALREGTLSVTALIAHGRGLPQGMLHLGFVFMLLGYGTKAGLFPLQSWLPDAHSEAPAPASAMLSGALLNCALVALWRASSVMAAAGDSAFVRMTLLPMGVLTVLAASLFLLKQRDLKRMLAYSSMENVGIMAVAIALGSHTGFALQATNHSLIKAGLFLIAGNLLQQYGSKSMRDIRGIITTRPEQALVLLLSLIAVAGTPPFGSFLAEWQILSTAADGGHFVTVVSVSLALAVAFIVLSVYGASMIFGEPSQHAVDTPLDVFPSHASHSPHPPSAPGRATYMGSLAIPSLLITASLILGLALTPTVISLFQGAAR